MKIYVLYHAGCVDGFAAAWIVRKAYQSPVPNSPGEIEFIPVQYDQPLPLINPGSLVYILDFCYPPDVMEEIAEKAGSVILIDHHKSAIEAMLSRHDGNAWMNIFGAMPVLDMECCGAVLTWKYFFSELSIPLFLRYIQDRDLWTWELENSREFSAGLRMWPMEFETWDELIGYEQLNDPGVDCVGRMIREGVVALRAQAQRVEVHMSRVFFVTIGALDVPVVNASTDQSDICHEILKRYPEAPFAACYFDVPSEQNDGGKKRVWSLRSEDNRMDVSEIAKALGGGGHRNAAGFTTWFSDGAFYEISF